MVNMETNNHNDRSKISVGVIGAGAAGICAARHLLKDQDHFTFEILEQTNAIGGTWVYSDKTGKDENGIPVHSSMYKNLRTNLPLQIMEFPDFPSKITLNTFVKHTEVLKYLQDYSKHFGIDKYVQFNQRVKRISRDGNKWKVKTFDLINEVGKDRYYDVVIVCIGRYSKPKYPKKIIGLSTFRGRIFHSHDYRDAKRFHKEKVVMLGAGPSGVDISIEISKEASEVYLCHQLNLNFNDLPSNIKEIKSTIHSMSGKSVILANGQILDDIDSVGFATGYHFDFDFLDPSCGVEVVGEGRVKGVYLHLINIENPTMALIGIPEKVLPFPIYNQQVLLFLKVLKGEVKLPSKETMYATAEGEFQKRLANGIPERHAHKMTNEFLWQYDDQLSEIGNLTKIRPVTRKIFGLLHDLRSSNCCTYRDNCFVIHNDEEFSIL